MSPPLGCFLGWILCLYSLFRALKVVYALSKKAAHDR